MADDDNNDGSAIPSLKDEEEGRKEEKFTLSLYEKLEKSQSSHGISHEDYIQYSHYCSNRLSRLRHNRAVYKDCVHNSKYVEGVSKPRRNMYCPRNKFGNNNETEEKEEQNNDDNNGDKINTGVEDNTAKNNKSVEIHHENFFWILLVSAERSWSQACQYQRDQKRSKQQQKVLSRLRKALKFATELEIMAEKTCTQRTYNECRSYTCWMRGNYALQKKEYSDALEQYTNSMNLLLQLVHDNKPAATSSNDDGNANALLLVLSDLWTMRAENLIRPLVRYCQYECKDYTPITSLQQSQQQATNVNENSIVVSYRGREIALDPYKSLCVLYLKVESLLPQLLKEKKKGEPTAVDIGSGSSSNENHFYAILSTLDDIIVEINKETTKYESLPTRGPAVNAKLVELKCLVGYFTNNRLQLCMNKNEERLVQCATDAEYVHVYDALLQNATAVTHLPNPSTVKQQQDDANNNNDDIDNTDTFYERAYAQVLRVRAFRCYYMAKLYSTNKNYDEEAMMLLKQTNQLIKRAIEEIGACDEEEFDDDGNNKADEYIDALEDLQKNRVNGLLCRIQANIFLKQYQQQSTGNNQESVGSSNNASNHRSLLMRMDDGFDSAPRSNGGVDVLVSNPDFPIETIPMPCKPSFYDIAYSYAVEEESKALDGIDAAIAKKERSPQSKSGYFGGWF